MDCAPKARKSRAEQRWCKLERKGGRGTRAMNVEMVGDEMRREEKRREERRGWGGDGDYP